jgi:hypothetical protein
MQTTHDKINSKQDVSYNFDNFFKISADFICIAGFDGYFKKINQHQSIRFYGGELYSRPLAVCIRTRSQSTIETREQVYKNNPLLNFENRYLTKAGEIVSRGRQTLWNQKKLVYAIAKTSLIIKSRRRAQFTVI